MLQCGLFRSNFAFAISRLSLPIRRYQQRPIRVPPSEPTTGQTHRPSPPLNGVGAGDGNRTHVASLEGWCSTIELHPPGTIALRQQTSQTTPVFRHFRRREALGGGGRIRTYVDIRRQIYSLLPLTARPPLRKGWSPGTAETAS